MMHAPDWLQAWQKKDGQAAGGRLAQAKSGQAAAPVPVLQLAKRRRLSMALVGAAVLPLARVKVRVLELERMGRGAERAPATAGTLVKTWEMVRVSLMVTMGVRPST